MTVKDCEKYISDIPKFAGKNTNADTLKILERLIDIKSLPPVIHVAGTNGKGSVCAFIQSILMESGKRAGMFISPHLVTMNERIMIDREFISDEQFVWAFEQVKSVVDETNHPSFFEYLFLMGMVYFAKENPDYIILETGLGGRLDATNCLPEKKVCVITEIGFDHMKYLGDTVDKIAFEKAGIIKPAAKVAFVNKRPQCTAVIIDKCEKEKCHYIELNQNDIFEIDEIQEINEFSGLRFSLKHKDITIDNIEINNKALYQRENASLAIMAAVLLEDGDITESSIKSGIKKMYWPGRMEQIADNIYVDGAHNEDGVSAMVETVAMMPGKNILLFAVVNDKDYQKMIDIIVKAELFEKIIVTKAGEDRATETGEIASIFKESIEKNMLTNIPEVLCDDDISDAYHRCVQINNDKTVIISGSLYLVGDIKRLIERENN